MSSSLIKYRKNISLPIILISLLPALTLIGSSVLNVTVVVIDLIFLIEIFKSKRIKDLNNKYFYGVLILWIVLIINLIFFSIDFSNSISRSLGFLRFLILVFAFKFYVFDQNEINKKLIFNSWLIIFSVISFDVIYEFITKKNILGFKSNIPGRLVSFLDQEYKIGYIYSFLGIISFLFVFKKYKKLKYSLIIFYIFIFFILSLSFLIGERSNFLKTFLMFFIFIFIIESKFFRMKYLLTSLFLFIVSIFLIFEGSGEKTGILQKDSSYKYRFWNTFLKPIIENPIESVRNSNYGDHYKTAYIIFKDYKITGVGLKNYRIIIYDENNKYNFNPSTHPHEKHLELLSELGLIGYLSFISLFIYYIYNGYRFRSETTNFYEISGSLFFISNLIPFIPSGSLFSTYSATFFWLSFSFLISRDAKS